MNLIIKKAAHRIIIITIGAVGLVSTAQRDCIAQDQEYDSLLQYYLEEDMKLLDEIENDTTSFFALLDSVLNLKVPSLLSLYTNYTSNVLYSGRDYDIGQYGITSGVSFFHRSGIYADFSGNYLSEVTPKYNSTNVTLGYAGYFSPKWNYSLSYDHYFYNTLDELSSVNYTLNNSIKAFGSFRSSFFTAGVEGSLYFGSGEQSYRLTPQLIIHPKIKSRGMLSFFSFHPSLFLPITDEQVYTTSIRYYTARRMINRIGEVEFARLYRREDSRLPDLLYTDTIDNVFTLANVSLALPLRLNLKNWYATAAYNLNFPIELPGETLDSSFTDYFSFSIGYSFGL